jgi:hypothetical protein
LPNERNTDCHFTAPVFAAIAIAGYRAMCSSLPVDDEFLSILRELANFSIIEPGESLMQLGMSLPARFGQYRDAVDSFAALLVAASRDVPGQALSGLFESVVEKMRVSAVLPASDGRPGC